MIPLLLIAFGLVALATGRSGASNARFVPDIPVGMWVRQWQPLVTQFAQPLGIPTEVALMWIQLESGGNPCSIGETKNPPQEYGLAQLNYPYDEKYGTRAKLRAYCNNTAQPPGIPANTAAGRIAWAIFRKALESQTRPLTQAEREEQVRSGILLIQHCREFAQGYAAKAGVNWNAPDRWKLVKLVHGLPTLVALLPVATRKLGRAPKSFAEFRNTVESMTDAELNTNGNISGRRARFGRTFDISEQVGRKAAV